ncbi:MAG: hypothetical protein AB8F94_05430 [Saprospiraceae bacterium]
MNKSNFSLSILFILFSGFLFTNCNKENLKLTVPSIPHFLQSLTDAHACVESNYNGNLIFQSYRTIHSQEITSARITGQFYGTNGLEDKGDLTIGNNITISADDQNRYETNTNLVDLYGNSNSITLADGSSIYFSENFSLPEMVKITYPSIYDDFIIEQGASPITWEVDLNNNIGVAMIIEYLPTFPGNETFVNQGFDKIILNTKVIVDNGSYNLESSDFEDIPDGALITVRIGRVECNSIVDSETGGKYFAFGYSIVDAMGKYMGGLD